jgi:hypothetical protein
VYGQGIRKGLRRQLSLGCSTRNLDANKRPRSLCLFGPFLCLRRNGPETSLFLPPPGICGRSTMPSNSGCGLAGFPSRTCPHRKFRSQLETRDVDSSVAAKSPAPTFKAVCINMRRGLIHFLKKLGHEVEMIHLQTAPEFRRSRSARPNPMRSMLAANTGVSRRL